MRWKLFETIKWCYRDWAMYEEYPIAKILVYLWFFSLIVGPCLLFETSVKWLQWIGLLFTGLCLALGGMFGFLILCLLGWFVIEKINKKMSKNN